MSKNEKDRGGRQIAKVKVKRIRSVLQRSSLTIFEINKNYTIHVLRNPVKNESVYLMPL